MKKVLLLSLSLVLGFSAFAQRQVIQKNDAREATAKAKTVAAGKEMATEASNYVPQAAKSVVVNRWDDMEDSETMMTYYDLQSNQYVANRMVQWADGSVAVVATMSHENNQTASDRGTGYNFFDGSEWQVCLKPALSLSRPVGLQSPNGVKMAKSSWLTAMATCSASPEKPLAKVNGNTWALFRIFLKDIPTPSTRPGPEW